MKSIAAAAFLALLASHAAVSQVRSISAIALDCWTVEREDGQDGLGLSAEETLILGASEKLSLIAKGRYASPSTALPYGGFGAGLSYAFSPGVYADLAASASWNTRDGDFMGELESSFNIERERLYTGAREQLRFGPSSFVALSGVFAKYRTLEWLSLWTSYILGYESGIGLDHSIWAYAELDLASAWSATAGGTAASFHRPGGEDPAIGEAYSAIAGADWRPTSKLALKYRFEYFFGDRNEGKTAHALVVDARSR